MTESPVRQSYRRYLSVVVTVLVGGLLTALVVSNETRHAREEMIRQLQWRATNEAARFQHNLDRSLEVVDALAGLFTASQEVDRAEFRRFVADPLSRHPELYALQWLPRIPQAQRARF